MAIPIVDTFHNRKCFGNSDLFLSCLFSADSNECQCVETSGDVDLRVYSKHHVGPPCYYFLSNRFLITLLCRYKSFSRTSDNIGDVTAKGESQTALVDILGIFVGIGISRITNASKPKVLLAFTSLMMLELYCTFQEIHR